MEYRQRRDGFLLEAEHMDCFAELNKGISYITCPEVYHDLTTKHVLVMERIHGIPVDNVDELKIGIRYE